MSPFKFLPNTKLRIFLTFIFKKKSVVGGRTEVHFEKNALLCTKIPGFYPTLQWARLFCRSYLEKLNSGTISLRLKIRDLLYSTYIKRTFPSSGCSLCFLVWFTVTCTVESLTQFWSSSHFTDSGWAGSGYPVGPSCCRSHHDHSNQGVHTSPQVAAGHTMTTPIKGFTPLHR